MKNLIKLIDVKSIVTIASTIALIIFTWKGIINSEVFAGIVGMIFTYFFTKKNKVE